MLSHRRHDITDKVWLKLEPHLRGRKGSWGGIAKDNRTFINAVFWVLRTGSPWRDLPPDYGHWSNVHRRFIRWRDKGVWEKLMEILIDSPDYEWLMIDASHCKVHPHGTGAIGGNQDMSRTKGAQHKASSCRGFAWHAGQGYYYTRYNSRLLSSNGVNTWHTCRTLTGRSSL